MNIQPPKGRWVYSWEFSKFFFIDEQDRIIDPDVANIQKPLNLRAPVVNAASVPVQNVVAPAPVQSRVAPTPAAAPAVQRNVALAPVPRPAPAQRYVAPSPPQRYVAPAPVPRLPVPARRRVTPSPSTSRNTRTVVVNRGTRSASVSSSGSSHSNASRRSTTSSRKPKTTQRYQKVWLNRDAVLRRGPSLNTRVKANLDKDTKITVDTSSIINIYYNDNLRKRIKVVEYRDYGRNRGWNTKGWVTVETEKGRLFRKCQASLERDI